MCIGQAAHECDEQAKAAQIALLTHRLVEARMVNELQAMLLEGDTDAVPLLMRLLLKQHLDDERRMRAQSS